MKVEETAKILTQIHLIHGDRFALDDPGKAAAWHALIGDMPYELALAAVQDVLRREKFPPTPAHVIEAAYGREVREPVFATDAFGCRSLRSDGTPVIESYETVRVGGLISRRPDLARLAGTYVETRRLSS